MRSHRLLLCICALLVACSSGQRSVIQQLPAEEVLNLAALATQKMVSAKFTVTGTFSADGSSRRSSKGRMRMDGIVNHERKQVRFQLDIDADIEDRRGDYAINSTIEVVKASEDEVYVNLHSLTVQPNNNFFRPDLVGRVAGQWWLLPSDDPLLVGSDITPDSRLLHAQSQIISITQNLGIDSIGEADAYHYAIELDKQKLLVYLAALGDEREPQELEQVARKLETVVANGEIWIDTESYLVHKVMWNIRGLPLVTGSAATEFVINFRNHNNAPDIMPPTSAKIFSPLILLGSPNFDYDFEQPLNEGSDSDEFYEDLIRTLNAT